MSDFGFSLDPSMVRVDIFKNNSGKFYTTIVLKFDRYFTNISEEDSRKNGLPRYEDIHDTFIRCMLNQYPKFVDPAYILVCLEPYHEHSYPLMIKS